MTTTTATNDSDNMVLETSSTQVLPSHHMDYVNHVAFDVYGRRVATCSGDRFVRVWDLGSDGSWSLSGQWTAHRGAVSQLSWCHPEFGTLMATCATPDQEVKVWEERPSSSSNKVWLERAQLTEARRPVTCLEFAPRHFGLQLATGSADGVCRIYEAVDLMNVAQWPLQGSILTASHTPLTCLSWCTGRFEPPTLALGGNHLLGIWRYNSNVREWQNILQLDQSNILDVAWAPNVGRRFHWIAAAQNGGPLRVYQLSRPPRRQQQQQQQQTSSSSGDTQQPSIPLLELESTTELTTSNDEQCWRCQWNVTGTVLASSGDGGLVRLWKHGGAEWKCVSEIYGDLTETAMQS